LGLGSAFFNELHPLAPFFMVDLFGQAVPGAKTPFLLVLLGFSFYYAQHNLHLWETNHDEVLSHRGTGKAQGNAYPHLD